MKLKRTEREIAFARVQGRRIYDLRNERGMSRRALSTATEIHPAMLFRIEMGDSTASAFQLEALAKALDTTQDKLFPTHRIIPIQPANSTFLLRRAFA